MMTPPVASFRQSSVPKTVGRTLLAAALLLSVPAASAWADGDGASASASAPAVSEQDLMALIGAMTEYQTVPAYKAFAASAADLSGAVGAACADGAATEAERVALRTPYRAAFVAWQAVQHLRFGPVMDEDRFHRIEYWPDPKGLGGRHLRSLLTEAEPETLKGIVPGTGFTGGSIAVQGFPALERLLWDDSPDGTAARRCQVMVATAETLKTMSADTVAGWTGPDGYRATLMNPGAANPLYRTPVEAMKAVYGSVTTLLQAMTDMKLSGPMGSGPDRARVERGEAWRADLTLDALRANARAAHAAYFGTGSEPVTLRSLVRQHPESEEVDAAVSHGLNEAVRLLDDVKGSWRETLESPQGYRTLFLIRSNLQTVRTTMESDVNGILGLGIGFNSLDGD